METKRSPWITVGGILLGLLGVWMCLSGAAMYRHFLGIHAVVLDARVERVEEVSSDSGIRYDVYACYDYAGKSYTSRYAQTDSQTQYAVGTTVTVTVDADHPETSVQGTELNALGLGIFGCLFVGLGAMSVPLHITPKAEGPYIRELTCRVANRKRYRILVVTPVLLMLVFMKGNPAILAVSALLLSLGILDAVAFFRDLRAASRGVFTLQRDKVTGQRMRQSESALFCTLILSGKRRYTHQIPKTVYSSFVKDATVTAIYLTGRKPEALVDPETEQMI